MTFLFEDLEVYQKSLAWNERAIALCRTLTDVGSRALADQLSRAAVSISCNLAEGHGRWHMPDKRQFYWIARGSLFECVSIVQTLRRSGMLNEADYARDYARLEELARLLSGLIRSLDKVRKPRESGAKPPVRSSST